MSPHTFSIIKEIEESSYPDIYNKTYGAELIISHNNIVIFLLKISSSENQLLLPIFCIDEKITDDSKRKLGL